MKNSIYVLLIIIFCACSSEKAPDCLKAAGKITQKEFDLATFDTITAYDKIKVVIKEAPTQRIVLETGEHLMADVSIVNESGNLMLKNANTCNMFREFDVTTVYVETPSLHTVKNCSGASIVSDGVLSYDTLNLVSENYNKIGEYRVDGTFDMNVSCNNLNLIINNLCTTTLKGDVTNLNIVYADGDARFEGRNLSANNITVFHRGTNDITVTPKQSLTAKLVSTGNLILTNTPSILEVEELYKGKVIVE